MTRLEYQTPWQSVNSLQRVAPEIWEQMKDVFAKNWHLGFTAFGGPPVHFQIMHRKFVEENEWIDEQLYQEIFALSQALPGPASTKMLYTINYIHGGFLGAILAFFLWCLPGAIGMYGLSLGVSRIGDTLPLPVYALLSGLNAATVGIIALAAVQLADKAITDKLTRLLVFLGGVAGMLYTRLWYFPALMAAAGIATLVWDYRLPHKLARKVWHRGSQSEVAGEEGVAEQAVAASSSQPNRTSEEEVAQSLRSRRGPLVTEQNSIFLTPPSSSLPHATDPDTTNRIVPHEAELRLISWKTGMYIIAIFLISFIAIMILRALLKSPPRGVSLFANLYLAGTIIFGGGPVVIPLLREYIVAEGWVSPRDFLLGLALIQSFPGPNFNFAVYLGSLATARTSLPSFAGALIAFIGIFTPGIMIVTGVMGLWKVLRSRRWLLSILRGVNAGAVGLVFTAVYKLWQIGYVDIENQTGDPLGRDPWWVAITATSFVGGAWFGLSAPFAILLGGVLGLVWYGVVEA
ncbi:related to chromate transport protein [Rhynchosporium secalis]|uniref:Related to chromate transport protein n=1 Tax=Rhynchosporium secalis TaxID=38038 RepID=A0A1E1MDN5_RHYSE|nr:related to chromate transport protein [Rhynchosporium secalis]